MIVSSYVFFENIFLDLKILADIIIMIQEEVPVHIKKGGIFITSGIINMKEQAVKDALAKNDAFEIIETTYQGEWVSITCRKK